MILRIINSFFIFCITTIIRIYQFCISPILNSNCRYLPTCSEYSIQAFRDYGFFRGFVLSIKRILKCHPLGEQGYDPVPKKLNNEEN